MAALRQNLNLLAIFKHTETYATLAAARRLQVSGWLVQYYGQAKNQSRVQPARLLRRRVWRVGGAAEPARVEQEDGDEEDDGDEDDNEEEGAAPDLELSVVEDGVVAVEESRRIRTRH